MNGFVSGSKPCQLMSTMLQNMFPTLNVQKVSRLYNIYIYICMQVFVIQNDIIASLSDQTRRLETMCFNVL